MAAATFAGSAGFIRRPWHSSNYNSKGVPSTNLHARGQIANSSCGREESWSTCRSQRGVVKSRDSNIHRRWSTPRMSERVEIFSNPATRMKTSAAAGAGVQQVELDETNNSTRSSDNGNRVTTEESENRLDDGFVWPESVRAGLKHNDFDPEMAPVIDMAPVFQLRALQQRRDELLRSKHTAAGDEEELELQRVRNALDRYQAQVDEVIKQVRAASEECGCYQIINHGFPLDRLAALMDVFNYYLHLPVEEKMKGVDPRATLKGGKKIPVSDAGREAFAARFSAYRPKEKVVMDFNSGGRWYEAICIPFIKQFPLEEEIDNVGCMLYPAPEDRENRFRFNLAVKEYDESACQLSSLLLELVAQSLGIPETDYFSQHFLGENEARRLVRGNYYEKCPQPDLTFGLPVHTDPVAITLLNQDEYGGLQVITREGKWRGVQPIPQALVVIYGDLMQAWTNDRYRSPPHRAVPNGEGDRLSIVHFYMPALHTYLTPPPQVVDEEHPLLYRPFTAGEFRSGVIFSPKLNHDEIKKKGTSMGLLEPFRLPQSSN